MNWDISYFGQTNPTEADRKFGRTNPGVAGGQFGKTNPTMPSLEFGQTNPRLPIRQFAKTNPTVPSQNWPNEPECKICGPNEPNAETDLVERTCRKESLSGF